MAILVWYGFGRFWISVADLFLCQITGLRASTNNRASTTLDVFLHAVLEHGFPSRVRGDRGRENVELSVLMILAKGLHRASFMWGSCAFYITFQYLQYNNF
jgi:hypothetical protein